MAAVKRKSSAKDIAESTEPRKSRRTSRKNAASNQFNSSALTRDGRRSKNSEKTKEAVIDGLDSQSKASVTVKRKNSKSKNTRTDHANIKTATAQPQVKTNDEEPTTHVSERQQYWLMKAEPESRIKKGVDVKFSIDDLKDRTEPEVWDGVRNYIARNNMRAMRRGDLAFFYHSNCKSPGIVGIMEIVQEASVDESAFDEKHPYFDPRDSLEKSTWSVVHVEFRRKFEDLIGLQELKSFAQDGGALAELATLRQSRLSVSKVSKAQWGFILGLTEKMEVEG